VLLPLVHTVHVRHVRLIRFTVLLTRRHHRCHSHRHGLLMVVQGHVAQLHLTARICRALDAHTLVRLGRIQLRTARLAHHLAGHIADAQLVATNLHLRVDFVQFVLVGALLERFLRRAGVVFVVDVARPIVCVREKKNIKRLTQ
jgi:hypothetical protein